MQKYALFIFFVEYYGFSEAKIIFGKSIFCPFQ